MEILSSRFLVHPRDFDVSLRFYRETLGLHPLREFGQGSGRGIVFFLGSGFLELTGTQTESIGRATELWLQVRDVREVEEKLNQAGVPILESTIQKPWGLLEMRAEDPDQLVLVFVEVPPDHPLRRDSRSIQE